MAGSISVPYAIRMDGGIVEANPPDGPYATVKFTCATNDRFQLVRDLAGTSVRSGKTIVRVPPYRYPPVPSLMCTSIESIEQYGKPMFLGFGTPWVGRNKCVVTAKFTIPTWDAIGGLDPSGQPYTTTTFSVGADKITIPQSSYYFSGNIPTNSPVGITLPVIQINMKRHMLPYVPLAEMATLAGRANSSPLTFLDYTFATGSVLFLGGDVTVISDTAGNLLWDCDYKMAWRAVPWNQFLHPNPSIGFALISNGTVNPYLPGDFSILP